MDYDIVPFLVTMSRNIRMNAESVIAEAAACSSAEGRPENQALRVGGAPALLATALPLFLDLLFVMGVFVRAQCFIAVDVDVVV